MEILLITHYSLLYFAKSPGLHFSYSYDKVGRVTNIINNEGQALNTNTVKVLFENYYEEVDELWLQKFDPEEMANTTVRASKRQRTLLLQIYGVN